MANEVSAGCNLSISKSGVVASGNKSASLTLVGNNYASQVFVTSTAGALIPVGGLTTYGGYFMLVNLDDTDTIGIYQDGATATVKMFDLLPGKFSLCPMAAAPGCKASANTPALAIVCTEP